MDAIYGEIDTSSDDEDYWYVPRAPALRRQQIDYFNILSERQFFMRFRMKKDTVQLLLAQIEPLIRTRTERNNPISPMNRLLLTLRFFATGCFIVSAGDFIGVSESRAEYIIWQVTQAIVTLHDEYIKMPTDEEERRTARRLFYEKFRFPRLIGVVDCSHVKLQSQGGVHAEVYRNRKGWFSKNVQIVGGPTLMIQDIITRWPGSSHDQTVFNASSVCTRFEQGEFENDVILGDSGYECRPYILVPIPNPTTEAENLYNESLIRTRTLIERLFGIWKRRFPILSIGVRVRKRTWYKNNYYINACAILHNICCLNKEEIPPVDPEVEPHIPNEETEFNQGNVNIQPDEFEINPRFRVRRGFINNYFVTLL